MNILAYNDKISVIVFTKCNLCNGEISRGIKSNLAGCNLSTDNKIHICKTCGIKSKEAFEGNF